MTGHYADGSVRDLTAEARFAVEPAGVGGGLGRRASSPPWPTARAGCGRRGGRTRAEVPVGSSRRARVRPVSYRLDVAAVLSKAGCNMGACHGNLNGKGGFRLSLRGDDPAFDLRRADPRRLRPPGRPQPTRAEPGRSSSRPARSPHEGGLRFAAGSPEAAHPARLDRRRAPATTPRPPRGSTRLTVFPAERIARRPGPGPATGRHRRVRRRLDAAT